MPSAQGQSNREMLETIWQEQAKPLGKPQDLNTASLFPAVAEDQAPQAGAQQTAERMAEALGWPEWARVYPKPSLAVVAASGLAKAQGRPNGVMWMAPGTGAPLECGPGAAGLAVLRGDWTPDAEAMVDAQDIARERGMLLMVDESASGCRLSPGGAVESFGLSPDLALYGPSLVGGAPLGILFGRGQAPQPAKKDPSPKAAAALAANLPALLDPATSQELARQGALLKEGLAFFRQKAGLGPDVDLEGPDAMPRLTGKRLFNFLSLAGDEGLIGATVLMLKPHLNMHRVLMSLARAVARLKVTPETSMKPEGWSLDGCKRVEEMLAGLAEENNV